MSGTDGETCPVCGRKRSEYSVRGNELPPGTILGGKYVVGRSLGEGGSGTTYLGKDTALDRKAVIKEYFPHGTALRSSDHMTVEINGDDEKSFERGRERFILEGTVLDALTGSDERAVLADVIDLIHENNTAYIVMEYIEGTTLTELVGRCGRIPADELSALIEPLFDALIKLHEAGLLHRDITPDNIRAPLKTSCRSLAPPKSRHDETTIGF